MSAHVKTERRMPAHMPPTRPIPAPTPLNTAFLKVYCILIAVLAFVAIVLNPPLLALMTGLALVLGTHWFIATLLQSWRSR